MALVLADRVRETSVTTGTGTLTLAGAVTGYQTFSSAIGNTNTCYYTIANPGTSEWEVGIGTVGAGTLARTTILSSSNAGSAVSFSAGAKDVFVTYPAEKAVYLDSSDAYIPASPVFNGNAVISDNSANAALRITQTGTGNALLVEDAANPDASPFIVRADGAVVRGHTASIAGSLTPMLQAVGADSTSSSIGQYSFSAINSGPILELGLSANATIGSQTVVADGNGLGAIRFSGSDGTQFIRAAQIVAQVDGTPGTNDMPGRLVYSTTADGASSPTERMRIDNAGRVGIGVTTPSSAQRFLLSGSQTLGTAPQIFLNQQTIQSDATGTTSYFQTFANTAAASFTSTTLNHYRAFQGTFGASSAVTNQAGFSVDGSLTGATNNYGFYSDIASGTGRWNFYANGTADNYFGGATTISVNSSSDALRITQVGAGSHIILDNYLYQPIRDSDRR